MPAGHYKSSPGDKPPSPQKTARRNSPAAPLPAPFRKGQERGLQEVPPAGEAMSADGNRTREAPASRRSGRGGSLPNGAAALMLESVVMRWIFVLYQGERAFYEESVLFWYLTGIKGEFNAEIIEKTLMATSPSPAAGAPPGRLRATARVPRADPPRPGPASAPCTAPETAGRPHPGRERR